MFYLSLYYDDLHMMIILWWSPYDDFLCHWFYSLCKAVFHHFSKWFHIHRNTKLNFLLASARPWPRPDLLTQLSPGSHLVPSAITISLSHSALLVTDMSLSLSSERIPLLSLSLRPSPLWVLTGPEELPLVTLSAGKCYMTFKPVFNGCCMGGCTYIEKFLGLHKAKCLKTTWWWICLLHFCFDRYFLNLPLRAHMAMPL